MICRQCGKEIPNNAKFCGKCGAKVELAREAISAGTVLVEKGMMCPTCGANYPLNSKFCKNDGTPLAAMSAPLEPAAKDVSASPEKTSQSAAEVLIITEETVQTGETPAPSPTVAAPNRPVTTEPTVACPKCGTSYNTNIKFCKKDGTPLMGGGLPVSDKRNGAIVSDNTSMSASTGAGIQAPGPAAAPAGKTVIAGVSKKSRSKTLIWVVLCLVVGILGLGTTYFIVVKNSSKPIQSAPSESTAIPTAPPASAPESVPAPAPEVAPAPAPAPAPPEPAEHSPQKKAKKPIRENQYDYRSAPTPAPAPAPSASTVNLSRAQAACPGLRVSAADDGVIKVVGVANNEADKNSCLSAIRNMGMRVKDMIFVK